MRPATKKVLPPVDALYWAMILAATALGEKLGDLVSMTLKLDYGPSAALLVAASLVAILVQLASPVRSVPLYWAVVVLTSTAGTTLADLTTRTLGLGYAGGSALLVAMLAALTLAWRRLAPADSIEVAMPRRIEALYWTEMLVAGTLGTASGDFLANDFSVNGTALGFFGAALVLAALLAALGAASAFARAPRRLLYWAAILVADPLGATLGDALDKPDAFGLGVPTAAAILACVFAVVVAYSMRRPVEMEHAAEGHA